MAFQITVLLIDVDTDNLALKVARCLGHQGGVRTCALSHHGSLRVRHSRYVSSYTSHADCDEAWLDAIRRSVSAQHIDVLLPVSEYATRFVARHADELGALAHLHPVSPEPVLEVATHKDKLAAFLGAEGFEFPRTVLHRPGAAFEEELDSFECPVLVKPVTGAGGDGIRFFDRGGEARDYLRAYDTRQRRCLVQSYIHGHDIDCSVLCQDGRLLAYTIQKGLVANTVRFRAPPAVQFVHDQRVLRLVESLMDRLKWSGIAHIDLRYDRDYKQLYVLEINARYWGSLFGSLCAGVNFPFLASLTAMNQKYARPDFQDGYFSSLGTHLRTSWKNPFKLVQLHRTPLRFGLADPLPELARLWGARRPGSSG